LILMLQRLRSKKKRREMDFHILGLFPESLSSYFASGLVGKAIENGVLRIVPHQLRDFSSGHYKSVDDKPYGGGAGMVFLPEVVVQAVQNLRQAHQIEHVVLTSPSGALFDSAKARQLSAKKSVLFLCGRYEGIDQRAIDLVVDEELSIGDYILTGGELASGVMIEAISRYVPGVVGKDESVANDSFENGLLEHAHYTRPEVFQNQPVPSVLLSGHHKNIETWRRQHALQKTWKRRPDLLKKAKLTSAELDLLKTWIHK
jgi:tRNA (guanine37-N1)-methyltransferase